MRICLFEDAVVDRLGPLTCTRPAFDLWCGAGTLLQRQLRAFLTTAAGAVVRPYLAPLCRLQHPALRVNDPDWLRQAPVVWVNARWLPPAALATPLGRAEVGLVDDDIAYVVTPAAGGDPQALPDLPDQLERWRHDLPVRAVGGSLIRHPWDLLSRHAEALEQDFQFWRTRRQCVQCTLELPAPILTGPRDRLLVSGGAVLEAPVVVDTRPGPVLIDRGAVVEAFSRLEGPCYVGPKTVVRGARVAASSLGPECRVGGEVESSIVQGYSNKAHEGFLGHSYVGEWVNLAAGTQVSDLRNDYRPVAAVRAGERVPTGLLKVGAFIGDHTKTGLGTLLNCGTLVGPFAQLLPSGELLPRDVPAFCQVRRGRLEDRNDLRQLFATAAVVMGRRGGAWTSTHQELFFELYECSIPHRRRMILRSEREREPQLVG